MATTIRELLVKLGIKADTKALKPFDEAVEKTKEGLEPLKEPIVIPPIQVPKIPEEFPAPQLPGSFQEKLLEFTEKAEIGLDKVGRGLTELVKIAAIAAAAVAAVTAAFIANTLAVAANGDEIGKTARALGMSAEEFQKWRAVADKAGISAEKFNVALLTLTRTAAAAAMGTGEAAQAYKDFGIDVKRADGSVKSQSELLIELAEKYENIENPLERAAALQRIFGEAGAAMGPLLAEGAEGIEEMMQRAEDLGLIMSEEAVRNAEKFTDAMTDVQGVITGIRNRLAMALMPAMTDMLNQFSKWFIANREIINQRIDKFMEDVAAVMEEIPKRAKALVDFFGGLERILIALTTAGTALLTGFFSTKVLIPIVTILSGLFTILGAIATALGTTLALATGLVVTVFGVLLLVLAQLAVLFGGFLLIVEDVYTFLQGGDSVWGRLLERFGLADKALANFWNTVAAGKEILGAMLDLLLLLGEIFIAVLAPAIGTVASVLQPLFDLFVAFVSWLGGGALDVVGFFIERLGDAADVLKAIAGVIEGLAGAAGIEISANSSAGAAAGAASTNNSTSNSVNQNNSITVNGAGDPGAVGGEVIGQIGQMVNGAAAAFEGAEI